LCIHFIHNFLFSGQLQQSVAIFVISSFLGPPNFFPQHRHPHSHRYTRTHMYALAGRHRHAYIYIKIRSCSLLKVMEFVMRSPAFPTLFFRPANPPFDCRGMSFCVLVFVLVFPRSLPLFPNFSIPLPTTRKSRSSFPCSILRARRCKLTSSARRRGGKWSGRWLEKWVGIWRYSKIRLSMLKWQGQSRNFSSSACLPLLTIFVAILCGDCHVFQPPCHAPHRPSYANVFN